MRRGTHCAAAQLRSDNPGESVDEACALRRACPPRKRPAAGAARRGWKRTRAIAALGLVCAARSACAMQAERSDGLCGCLARVPFCACREAQGRGWCVCRRTHALRELTRRSCLNGARQRAVSSAAHSMIEHRRLPRCASAGVTRSRVALSLVTFFRRSERKLLRRRAHIPASRPQQSQSHSKSYQNNSCQRLSHKPHSPKALNTFRPDTAAPTPLAASAPPRTPP